MYIYDIHNMTQEELVNIIISNASDKPIYEQITAQIKRMIISGELPEGTALPSMRLLAKELRISVITTKRAYTDLEPDGFIETVTDKGSFAAGSNLENIMEEQMRLCEEHLQRAVDIATQSGITYEELREILELLQRRVTQMKYAIHVTNLCKAYQDFALECFLCRTKRMHHGIHRGKRCRKINNDQGNAQPRPPRCGNG